MLEKLLNFFKRDRPLSAQRSPLTFEKLAREYDIFYICYDEPNRKRNWQQIQAVLPKARKVEGVTGFDRALKTCARQSQTAHFFVIDGDNQMIVSRFKNPVWIAEPQDTWVLSWSAFNPLNGLRYGNGGVKLWPRDVALQMRTHENASSGDDPTDYCFVVDYYLIDDFISETQVTSTPQQAFRAGLREGVKMSLDWGRQADLSRETFQKLGPQNRLRLQTWCNVGADQPNGYWAILGARLGLKLNAIDKFDYRQINSLDWIDQLFQQEVVDRFYTPGLSSEEGFVVTHEVIAHIDQLGELLQGHLGLELRLMSPDESRQFKRSFQNPKREGLLRDKKPTQDQ